MSEVLNRIKMMTHCRCADLSQEGTGHSFISACYEIIEFQHFGINSFLFLFHSISFFSLFGFDILEDELPSYCRDHVALFRRI